jgi:hypothetical protein
MIDAETQDALEWRREERDPDAGALQGGAVVLTVDECAEDRQEDERRTSNTEYRASRSPAVRAAPTPMPGIRRSMFDVHRNPSA